MTTQLHNDIRQIIELRWQREFDAAIELFKSKIAPHGKTLTANHPKLIAAVCDCLREKGKIPEAVQFVVRWLQASPKALVESGIGTNMGWLFLFHFQNMIHAPDANELEFCASLLESLLNEEENSLAERLFFVWANLQKQNGHEGWLRILKFLETFPPEKFSTKTHTIELQIKGKPKKVELASAREQGVMLLIKAAYATQQFEKCIDLCMLALDTDINFHYGNQIWITRYLALAYRQIGDIEKAIHHLQLVLQRRKEWFIMKELAEMHVSKQRKKEALKLAREAVLFGGYSPYKAGLFEFLGDLVYENEADEGMHWYLLAVKSRAESGWRISQRLMYMTAANANANTEDATQLYGRITSSLRSNHEKSSTNDLGYGKITRILHEGPNGDGFITADDGRTIYFRISQSKVAAEWLIHGTRVSFCAVEEERKGKKVWRATKVYKSKEK